MRLQSNGDILHSNDITYEVGKKKNPCEHKISFGIVYGRIKIYKILENTQMNGVNIELKSVR